MRVRLFITKDLRSESVAVILADAESEVLILDETMQESLLDALDGVISMMDKSTFQYSGFSVENTQSLIQTHCLSFNRIKHLNEDMIVMITLYAMRGPNIDSIMKSCSKELASTISILRNVYKLQPSAKGNKDAITLSRVAACAPWVCLSVYQKGWYNPVTNLPRENGSLHCPLLAACLPKESLADIPMQSLQKCVFIQALSLDRVINKKKPTTTLCIDIARYLAAQKPAGERPSASEFRDMSKLTKAQVDSFLASYDARVKAAYQHEMKAAKKARKEEPDENDWKEVLETEKTKTKQTNPPRARKCMTIKTKPRDSKVMSPKLNFRNSNNNNNYFNKMFLYIINSFNIHNKIFFSFLSIKSNIY